MRIGISRWLLALTLTTAAAAQPAPEGTAAFPAAEEPPPAPPATAPATTASAPAELPPPPPRPAYAAPAYPPGAYGPAPPAPPPAPPPERRVRDVSITLSPIHLLLPVFELMPEVRATDHFGVAGIFGYGSITAETGTGESIDFRAFEIGGQLVGYPLQPFDSLQLGVEVLYVTIDAESFDRTSVRGVGNGLAVGPFVGYKLLTSGGFTFVAQGGIEYLAISAEAEDTQSGQTAQEADSRVIALVNLNLGWSF